jgi:UPF0176 protein
VIETVVAALYKFARLEDYVDMRGPLQAFCEAQDIRGTILLALEGINGTVSGSRAGIDALLARLKSDPRLADLEHKESYDSEKPFKRMPFKRMKVRLKKEIVTIGVPEVDPNDRVGVYVSPQDWNELISDPEVILLDTRNSYEYEIGSFKGAIDPATESFRQFPDYVAKNLDNQKHKKIAMFCTGGIRCEKASSFMLAAGFKEVYHLKGGILKYLEEVPPEESLWQGECFVFDERVSVGHGLKPGPYELCRGCRNPITEADKTSPKYEEAVSCPHCHDRLTEAQKDRFRMRQKQMATAKSQAVA